MSCFRAALPTTARPDAMATTDGTRLEPSSPGITTGFSPCMKATSEFVVPRSIPTTRLMVLSVIPLLVQHEHPEQDSRRIGGGATTRPLRRASWLSLSRRAHLKLYPTAAKDPAVRRGHPRAAPQSLCGPFRDPSGCQDHRPRRAFLRAAC